MLSSSLSSRSRAVSPRLALADLEHAWEVERGLDPDTPTAPTTGLAPFGERPRTCRSAAKRCALLLKMGEYEGARDALREARAWGGGGADPAMLREFAVLRRKLDRFRRADDEFVKTAFAKIKEKPLVAAAPPPERAPPKRKQYGADAPRS